MENKQLDTEVQTEVVEDKKFHFSCNDSDVQCALKVRENTQTTNQLCTSHIDTQNKQNVIKTHLSRISTERYVNCLGNVFGRREAFRMCVIPL